MCVTSGPARLSRTILYGAEVKAKGNVVHVLGYQNRARNLSPGPNAMLLPFPAMPSSMYQQNVIDTKDCPRILEDMAKALTPATRGLSFGDEVNKGYGSPRVEVFNHGIYTVVLAEDASAIPGALHRVPADRRPPVNSALFEAYAQWYPAWAVALCCFNNRDAKDATPMLWWYEPSDGSELFLPTLDCHTGDVPGLNDKVTIDHTIAVGSFKAKVNAPSSVQVDYSERIPSGISPYLVPQVMGGGLQMLAKNGDLFMNISDVREGIFVPKRRDPLGSEAW